MHGDNTPENVRPWGRYDVLDEAPGFFKVKRITVQPGMRLSYQSHAHRSEHWIIVAGHARVTLDGEAREGGVGGTFTVAVGQKHRIENAGEIPLVFIEVQLGGELGEGDIVRHEDDFGRAA